MDQLSSFMDSVKRLFADGLITQLEARAMIVAAAALLGLPSLTVPIAVSAA